MNFYAWTGLINALTAGLMGLFVVTRKPNDPRHLTFGLLTFSITWWSLFYWLWLLSPDYSTALVRIRICLTGAVFIHACFLHHILTITKKISGYTFNRRLMQCGYILSGMLSLSSLTPSIIERVEQKLFFPYWPVPGLAGKAYTVIFFFYVIYATRLIYLVYRTSSGSEQQQFKYLFWATVIAFTGGATNFFLWYDIPIPPIGNVVVPFYVILVALAVIRYQFLDIKVAITQTGLLLATYLIVLGAPFAVGWWGKGWLKQQIGDEWWLVPLGLCTVLATVGPFAYAFLRRQAEEQLLKGQRRYQRILQHAARDMTRVRDLGKLVRLIVVVVSRTVGVQHASLFLWDTESQRYVLAASQGPQRFAVPSHYQIEPARELVRWLQAHRRAFSREELAEDPARAAVAEELAHLNSAFVVPGFIEDELVGFLMLGDKLSGAAYSPDDLHAFSTLANEASVAIENARSYGELLKVHEQLRAAYNRLVTQEHFAAAGRFATGMAHEIKNPLSAIKTFAEYLPEKYQDPEFRGKFFRIVQSEIDRINTIVTDLLEFAKPAKPQLQPVRIAVLLEETLTLLSSQLLAKGIELRRAFQENGLVIQADPKQLKQVLLNLILNSLDAMPDGGRLDVRTQAREGWLILQISDTGCGIQPEHHHQVFDPFFTTKERGMGLGLAVVKGIVDRHGGQIFIRSDPGQGTTAELMLPVAKPSSGSFQ